MSAKDASATVADAIMSLKPFANNIELCFVDDGSSDSTHELAVKTAHHCKIKIKTQSVKENIGVPKARNIAAKMASARWLMIHDADDICLPCRLEETLSCIGDHDIVGGWAIKKKNNSIIGVMDYPPADDHVIKSMLSTSWLNPMIDPTVCFNRQMFEDLGGYSEEEIWRHVQDLEFWQRAARSGAKFLNILKPMIIYAINPQGVTQTKKSEMIRRHMQLIARHSAMKLSSTFHPSWR
jgi:glycosyltransferase involved in cell wall biosynthesis